MSGFFIVKMQSRQKTLCGFILIGLVLLSSALLFSSRASAISITDSGEYPNNITSNSTTGDMSFVDTTGTEANPQVPSVSHFYWLEDSSGTNRITNSTFDSAFRSLGYTSNYSSYELFVPTAGASAGSYTVTVNDACEALKDANGWEDAGVYSNGENLLRAYYTLTNVAGGQEPNQNTLEFDSTTTCSGNDLKLTIPSTTLGSSTFTSDPRYGTGWSTAGVTIGITSGPNGGIYDAKKNFTVSVSGNAEIFPMSNSSAPSNTASPSNASTYGPNAPDTVDSGNSQDVINLGNPAATYYFGLPDGHSSANYCDNPPGANTSDCYAGETTGGFGSLNTPNNQVAAQCTYEYCNSSPQTGNDGTQINPSNTSNGAGSNDFNFYFSPDCSYSSGSTVYLKWYRGEGSGGDQKTDETFSIINTATGQSVYNESAASLESTNGYAPVQLPQGTLVGGTTYDWQWNNVDKGHGITLIMPFSEFTATNNFDYSNCNYSLTSHTTVDQSTIVSGQDATFTNWIHNNGPADASNFSWQIQGNYRDSNGTSSGWSDAHCGNDPYDNTPGFKSIISQTGPPSSCPTLSGAKGDSLSALRISDTNCDGGQIGNTNCKYETYTFPSSAVSGDQYCIRITYTDPYGSSSPSDTGSCVTFKALTGLSGFCDYASFNTGTAYGADTSIRYALFEAPTGAIPTYTAGEEVPGATAKSFPNLATGSISSNDAAAPGSVHTYDLTPAQISSGNVSWYLITYNDATINKVDYAYIDSAHSASETGCNSATCSVNIQNDGPVSQYGLGDVVGNQAFSYTVTIFNTGNNTLENPLTTQAPTYSLSGTSNVTNSATGAVYQANAAHPISGAIPAGGSATTPAIGVTAPYDTQAYTITAYPDYYGKGPIGTPCTTTFNDFENFNITGSDSVSYVDKQGQPTEENPYQANMIFQAENTDPFPAPSTMTMELYYVSAGNPDYTGPFAYGPNAVTAEYGSNIYNPTTLLTGWHAGDSYCSYMTINAATGYVGPGGVEVATAPASFPGNCPLIQNEPYVHVLGNDAVAGGGFGDNCNVSQGGIYTFSHASAASGADGDAGPTGSGSQFGAQAYSIIEGLSSANLRANAPSGSMGLTFANNVNNSGSGTAGSDAANLGGSFGTGNCVPDYASEINSDTSQYSPSSTISVSKTYTAGTGSGSTTTIGSGSITPITVNPGVNSTIYVNGNVYINSNIVYADSASGWTSIADVPSLYVIASGNIYIAPTVTRLDGVYVAEAKNGSGGTLDTCANVLGSFSSPDLLYGDTPEGCNTQLVVNGAVVANQVDLNRSFSSLRYAVTGEDINTPGATTHSCGTLGQEVNSAGYANTLEIDCAAEIFNFSPELYLSTPDLKPVSGPTTGKFDDITSLSPVL